MTINDITQYILVYILLFTQAKPLFKEKSESEHPPVRGEKMSKRLGGIKGCKYKTSSWHLNEFPYYGGTVGSTV